MNRSALRVAAIVVLAMSAPALARASGDLVNDEGASAPCIGIGPIGGPVADYCVEQIEAQGFLPVENLGVSGLTIGDSGDSDGVVTKVEPGSPAAAAGIAVGDVIVAVDGQPVRPTPGDDAVEQSFGERGKSLTLHVSHAGAERDVSFVRAPRTVANAPKSNNPLIGIHPVIDWRGKFVPCMGVGPLGPIVLAACDSRFKKYGFIPITDAGSTGFSVDRASASHATVKKVKAGSPAAAAGLAVGDEILAVDGKPLTASLGEAAGEKLFGKVGTVRRISFRRGAVERTVSLTLAAKAKG